MNVLIATDGSAASRHAAEFLTQMKLDSPVRATIATISHDPAKMATSYVPVATEWLSQERERVQKAHEDLTTLLTSCCSEVNCLHRIGDASTELLAMVSELDIDLIIIGAVGHSLVRRIFLGSVSDNVATHAKCSVLIVRPESETENSQTPKKPTTAHRIGVAYDGSQAARSAVDEIGSLPWSNSPEVDLITIVPQYDYLMGDGMTAAAMQAEQEFFEQMKGENTSTAEKITDQFSDVTTIIDKSYHVGDGLIAKCEEANLDLIVVGDTGHSRVEEFLLGSTTKYVLRHAPCSVWISREHRQS